jgi:uncharacterized protein (DUF2147 family)
MKLLPHAGAVLLLSAAFSCGQQAGEDAGIFGDWQSKAGSIVRIERCGTQVCMRLVQILNTAGATTDFHNPDAALRNRSLCGLQIGNSFTLSGPNHAEGGILYDPKSGKSYRGSLSVEGTTLHLRGYVGIPIFGATQDWDRPNGPVTPCTPQG